MANVFSIRPGYVVRLEDDVAGAAFTLKVEGFQEELNALLTGVSVSSRANVQFQHTLRNLIYAYVFGERLGEMTLSGLCLRGRCEEEGVGGHGLEGVQDYYNRYGLASFGNFLSVEIGGTAYRCLLVGFQAGLNDPERLLGQFQLQCQYLPRQG